MIELELTQPEEEARLDRYERLRGRLHLPRIEVQRLARSTRVRMESPPDAQPVSREVTARVLGWLAHLEREWASSLAADLWPGEVRWDPARSLVVVGRGLLTPSGSRVELQRWAAQLGTSADDLRGYVELAALAAQQQPDLQPLLHGHASGEQVLRELRELGRRQVQGGAHAEALRTLSSAHVLRPSDASIAMNLVEAAAKCGRGAEVPASAVEVLRSASRDRADAALGLARWHRAQGNLHTALELARRAAQTDPTRRDVWKAVALLAEKLDLRDIVLEAVSHLAELGSDGALAQIWAARGPSACFGLMDRWTAPPTPRYLRFRLEQLHLQERLKELLQLFTDNLDALATSGALDEIQSMIVEAAERVPGALLALRRSLYQRWLLERPGDGEVRLFLRACLAERVFAPVVELEEQHPGSVPISVLAQALYEERRVEELLSLDGWQADPELALLRLRGMVHVSLRGRRLDGPDWRGCVRVITEREGTRKQARELILDVLSSVEDFHGLTWLRSPLGLD